MHTGTEELVKYGRCLEAFPQDFFVSADTDYSSVGSWNFPLMEVLALLRWPHPKVTKYHFC